MDLKHILSAARAGATQAAWAALNALPANVTASGDGLTLKGRLLKDQAATANTGDRHALLKAAGEAYAGAYALNDRATYPLINAATLSFLGGAQDRAMEWATRCLDLIDSGQYEPETPYWLGATRAEALLLLGQHAEARHALRRAMAEAPMAWEDHAVTLRQFRLILHAQHQSDDWLDSLISPPCLYYSGPLGVAMDDLACQQAIAQQVDAIAPAYAAGSLAAGFDLLVADALQQRGIALHVVLPIAIERFRSLSVDPLGDEWGKVFDRIIAKADRLEILDEPGDASEAAMLMAEHMALGAAACEAASRGTSLHILSLDTARLPAPLPGKAIMHRIARDSGVSDACGHALAAPQRPIAVMGCGFAGVEALRAATEPAHFAETDWGAFAIVDDIGSAANLACRLFAKAGHRQIAIDIAVPDTDGDGLIAPERLVDMLALEPLPYPLATRPAALALMAADAPYRTSVIGESGSIMRAFEYCSLWPAG